MEHPTNCRIKSNYSFSLNFFLLQLSSLKTIDATSSQVATQLSMEQRIGTEI
jgi:hypothetical protein